MSSSKLPPVINCIPIEFVQPWDHDAAIRQVAQYKLGNCIQQQNTAHVGASDAARDEWKKRYPHLSAKIDATPRFHERPARGMAFIADQPLEHWIAQLELCKSLGLHVLSFLPPIQSLPDHEAKRLAQAGKGVALSAMIMGENLSILQHTLPIERLKKLAATPAADQAFTPPVQLPDGQYPPSIFDDVETLDFASVQAWFVGRFKALGERVRQNYDGPLSSIEASSQIRLCMLAGVDIPLLELVPHEPLRGIAGVRGAARAYGKTTWGVHTAMGYFRPPADHLLPRRLAIAYRLFFAAGCSIFSECNMPLRVTGSCSGFFTIQATPPIRKGESELLDFEHPIPAAARDFLIDFHRFTKFHMRPAAHPRVKMGYITGHLDSGHERLWMADLPGFWAPDAAKTADHIDHAFDSEPWYTPPRMYYWQADPAKPLHHGTPPCGQVDLVPIEAQPAVLATYGALAMLGWNTMTPGHYQALVDYVKQGGILFLSLPHLSIRTRTDRPQTFVNDGDLSALCGVKVVGQGEAIEEVLLTTDSSDGRVDLPQGTLYLEPCTLGKLTLAGAQALAVSRDKAKPGLPVLLEHRVGKGTVFLLNTWEYPGERLKAFMTDVLRTLADSQQQEIAVRSRDVYYSLFDGTFPSGQAYSTVYLVNHNVYGQSVFPSLILNHKHETPIRVPGYDMRIAWLIEGILISPSDPYVKITDAVKSGTSLSVTLESLLPTPSAGSLPSRTLQLAHPQGWVNSVTLNKVPVAVQATPDNELLISITLTGFDMLEITFG
jgi:hypothetical protein